MIDLHGMVSIPYFNDAMFTGSEKDTCFRLRKKDTGDGSVLEAAAWHGPYAYAATPDSEKTYAEFPLDNGGIEAAVAWLNEYCASQEESVGNP